MDNIEIRQPDMSELTQVQQLRHVVLDTARLIKTDHQLTAKDFAEETIHMAAFDCGEVVGTVRLDLVGTEPNIYEVRKMVVVPTTRGKGVVRLMLSAALTKAQSRGATGFTLDARREAIPFFKKLGFELTGKRIVHADGVPNYAMERTAAIISS
ncbi:GNAT family N-acetyltransferase [Candidatus Saccharibacteria bacterium]|nr:MAG: GNAT family N-acetyltransferase [Candidatus Saccharibacteria bacterium]